jgi:uracil-DNA glycosylase family 4
VIQAPQDCDLCPRLAKSRKIVINGLGPTPSDYMIVTNGPTNQDERAGTPVYPWSVAGRKLHRLIKDNAGMSPKQFRWELITRCRPPMSDDHKSDKAPTGAEVNACRDYLMDAIRATNPKFIVTLDGPALKWFFPKAQLDAEHGRPLKWRYCSVDNCITGGGVSGVSGSCSLCGGDVRETSVYPTYHPARTNVGRTASYAARIIDDWERFGSLVRGEWSPDPGLPDYRLATGEEVREYLKGATIFAFDFESTDNWYEGTFTANRAKPIGFSVSVRPGSALYCLDDISCIREELESGTIEKVAHNAAYEYILCAVAGVTLRNFHCTKVMAYVLREPSTGLKDLSWTVLGVPQRRYDSVDWEDAASFVPYGCADSDLTLQIFHIFLVRLGLEPNLLWVYEEVERGCIGPLADIHLHGVPFNIDLMWEFEQYLAEELQDVEWMLHGETGQLRNWSSTTQLKELLYGPKRWTVRENGARKGRLKHISDCPRTKGIRVAECDCHGGVPHGACSTVKYIPPGLGLPPEKVMRVISTGIPALRELKRKHPEVTILCDLLEYRATILQTLANECQSLPKLVQEDGRIHFRIKQAGDVEERKINYTKNQEAPETGRLSGADPNPMNRLNHGDTERPYMLEWAKRARRPWHAPQGWTWVKVDVSREEPNIGAFLSGDHNYWNDLNNRDIYKQAAAIAFDIPYEAVDKEQRQVGKRMHMAWLNGARASGIRRGAHWMTKTEATAFCEGMDAHYARLTRWMLEEVIPFLYENGCIYTFFGRKCLLYKIHNGPSLEAQAKGAQKTSDQMAAEREVRPMMIQGTAGDVLKLALQKVVTALDPSWAYIIMPIHDELDLLVRDDMVDHVCRNVLAHMMEDILPFPLKVEIEYGDNWADLKIYNLGD